jgi:hypothetical protein
VTGHGARVAEREVDVLVAVQVRHAGAARVVEIEREAAGREVHPGHRHPAEQVRAGRGVRGGRAGVGGGEGGALAVEERAQARTVDHAAAA